MVISRLQSVNKIVYNLSLLIYININNGFIGIFIINRDDLIY